MSTGAKMLVVAVATGAAAFTIEKIIPGVGIIVPTVIGFWGGFIFRHVAEKERGA